MTISDKEYDEDCRKEGITEAHKACLQASPAMICHFVHGQHQNQVLTDSVKIWHLCGVSTRLHESSEFILSGVYCLRKRAMGLFIVKRMFLYQFLSDFNKSYFFGKGI